MVAGWDRLLPSWFSRLHPRYKTPINSIIFVGALTLAIAIASQIGAGIQEAFQLVDNAANVFYGIVYFTMFAIPIFGAGAIRSRAPIWLRIAAICGAAVSLSAIFFTIHPIIDVPSPRTFAAKIIAVTAIANAIGVAIYLSWQKTSARLTAVFAHPPQVFREPAPDRKENDLRNIVGMKRSKLVLERRLPVFADFEEDEGLVSRFDLFLPTVNRFDRRQNIRARRKAFHQPIDSKSGADFRVRKGA